jgi:hypothetical protein
MIWAVSSGVALASLVPILSTDSVLIWLIFAHEP